MIENVLSLLLEKHYLSRKQYREMLALRLKSTENLEALLLERKIIEPGEAREILQLLSGQNQVDFPESHSPQMQDIFEQAQRVAASETTVLLLGESGVGKSRLARFIHEHSTRRGGPFTTVSCGSIPETLLESELFGAEKGAYTGAVRNREGKFKTAQGGTLFLDEIGEVSLAVQVKLLRAIQERKIEPLGSDRELDIDVRLVAATNRNLEAAIKTGAFRQDLYYRLNVVPFVLPPLRQRQADLPGLIEYFLSRQSQKQHRSFQLNDGLKNTLLSYEWPGNIRELENCIERLCVLSLDGELRLEHLPAGITGRPRLEHPARTEAGPFQSLEEAEKGLIFQALEKTHGNVSEAAFLLKIHRNSLGRKIKELGLELRHYKKSSRPS